MSTTVDPEISESLGHILTNPTSELDGKVQLAVVSNLNELSDSQLSELFDSGTMIAVVHPNYSQIASFFNAHPEWNSSFDPQYYSSDDYIYYFDSSRNSGTVGVGNYDITIEEEGDDYEGEDSLETYDSTEEDPNENEGDTYNDYYYTLGSWLEHLDNHILNNDDYLADYSQWEQPRLENLMTTTHHGKTFKIKLEDVVRKESKISGTASVTISYDVYRLHAYEGNDGSGNYYIVKSNFSINNAKMYAGKNKQNYKGLSVRTIGFICESAAYSTDFISAADEHPVSFMIPASYGTVPESSSGGTKFTSSQEFSLGANVGWSKEKGPSAGINAGAKWGQSQERTIKDVEISNLTDGAKPGWALIFQNLPYYSAECKFKEVKDVKAFKENQQLDSQWVWYEADAKDDVEDFGHFFLFSGEIVYKAMSFISTGADLKTKTYRIKLSSQVYPEVPPVYNKRKGNLVLVNDKDKFISNIRVFNPDYSITLDYFDPNSYPAGKEINLGWYEIKDGKYTVAYDCEGKTFKYRSVFLTLKHQDTVTLYASEDFKEW